MSSKRFFSQLTKVIPSTVPSGLTLGASTPLSNRRVIIYKPCRNNCTSGTGGTDFWLLRFEHQGSLYNPLLGYNVSSDPVGQLRVNFDTKESAISFAKKNEWSYVVEDEILVKRNYTKAYDQKFKWRGVPKRVEDDI